MSHVDNPKKERRVVEAVIEGKPEQRVIGPVDESELPEVRDTAIRASSARYRGAEAVEAEEKEEQKKAEEAPKGQAKSEEQVQSELLLGKFKTVEEMGKSYQELEAHATRLAQEMASLKQPQSQSSDEDEQLEIPKELEQELFDSPKTAVAKIVDLAAKHAVGKVRGEQKAKTKEQQVKEVQGWFEKECSDLKGNRAAALAIEGLASEAEGSTLLEKFQNATKTYRELVQAAKVEAGTQARETASETQRQVDRATMPEGKKASGNGRKIWKASDIEWMMEHDTAQYQRLQNEIVKARQEGRVREDL